MNDMSPEFNKLSIWDKIEICITSFFGLIYFLIKNKFDLDDTEAEIDQCLIKIKQKEMREKYRSQR